MQISNNQNTITMPNGDVVEFVPNNLELDMHSVGCAFCYYHHKPCRSVPCFRTERNDESDGTFALKDRSLQDAL